MSEKIATIIGATGMIGNYLLEELLTDNYFDTIRVVVRRPYQKIHSKLEVKLVDFSDTESVKLAIDGSDTVFSCIGTTQKKVKGNHELYRQIDFDIPAKAARLCKETGCEKFVLVSSIGANSRSNTFYLKLKGELENAIQVTGLRSVHIMQPSMLLGKRDEKRSGETFLQGSLKTLSGIFIGSFRKYRAIHGRTVARAMLNAAKKNDTGFYRYSFDDINKLAGDN